MAVFLKNIVGVMQQNINPLVTK